MTWENAVTKNHVLNKITKEKKEIQTQCLQYNIKSLQHKIPSFHFRFDDKYVFLYVQYNDCGSDCYSIHCPHCVYTVGTHSTIKQLKNMGSQMIRQVVEERLGWLSILRQKLRLSIQL